MPGPPLGGSTPIFEVYECAEWIKATLENDAGLGGLFEVGNPMVNGVYMDMAPEDAVLPVIRYHVQASKHVRGVGPDPDARIMTDILWLIVVMNEGHLISPLVPIVTRLDQDLDGQSGTSTNATILSCVMEEPFQLLETDKSGVQVRHAGGLYRTIVVPT